MVGGGKIIETKVKRNNTFSIGQDGITFSFPYSISGDKTISAICNIHPSLPGYIELYNDKITNITFSNNIASIATNQNPTYLSLQRYNIDLTITSTNKSRTYSNMFGLLIEPEHLWDATVGYCAPETVCNPSIYDPKSCAMTLTWRSYETTYLPDETAVSINFL